MGPRRLLSGREAPTDEPEPRVRLYFSIRIICDLSDSTRLAELVRERTRPLLPMLSARGRELSFETEVGPACG